MQKWIRWQECHEHLNKQKTGLVSMHSYQPFPSSFVKGLELSMESWQTLVFRPHLLNSQLHSRWSIILSLSETSVLPSVRWYFQVSSYLKKDGHCLLAFCKTHSFLTRHSVRVPLVLGILPYHPLLVISHAYSQLQLSPIYLNLYLWIRPQRCFKLNMFKGMKAGPF